MIETIVLFKHIQLLLELQALRQSVPTILLIARLLLEELIDHGCPVLLAMDRLVFSLFQGAIELPLWRLFLECLAHLLFLECFLFKLFPFGFTHLDFLNLGAFLGFNSLPLYGCALVLHLWNGEAHVKLDLVFLSNVVEGKLHDHLPELSLAKSFLDGVGVPDNINDKCRFSFLVCFFSLSAKTERYSESPLRGALDAVLLGDVLLLERVHELVRGHIDKDLAAALDIFCLDNKTFLRLHSGATFRIDDWVSIFIDSARLLLLSEYF
jgi:hypothetical protein